jgi:hypothetical protein
MSIILCQICHAYTAPTCDELIAHIMRDHDRVVAGFMTSNCAYNFCYYGHLGFDFSHDANLQEVHRFLGLLDRCLYHALLGDVLKCHCGLPFASI